MASSSAQSRIPLPPAAIYPNLDSGFAALQAHAKDNGYAFARRDSNPTRLLLTCDRGGDYNSKGKRSNVNESNRRRQTGTKKTSCPMRVSLLKDKKSGLWKLSIIKGEHNHAPSADFAAHSAHRIAATPAEILSEIDVYAKAGLSPAQIITTLRTKNSGITLTAKDVSNIIQKKRTEELNGMSPIHWLLKELQANDYSPAYEPQSGHLQKLFLIAPTSIQLWKQHSDVLLLDCTYKTNRFNMPLLNICGITGNNIVVQLAICFLSGETEKDYKWALTQLRIVMSQHMIQEPISIVTDRELALIKCLDTQFPSARHILCRWHVNMNVLAKTKKFFPGPIKSDDGTWTRHPSFQAFLACWNSLLGSPTEQQYDDLLLDMHIRFPAEAMSYVAGTWLLWKEKLVAFWTNQALHFGITVTSPIEGSHATLKKYLQRGHGDLRGVFLKLKLFWETQSDNIRITTATQKFRPKHSTNKPLFAAVLQNIHGYALLQVNQEHSKLNWNGQPPPNTCTCVIQRSHGLPCFHKIFQRKRVHGCILPEDIHPHWWYDRLESSTFAFELTSLPLPILNPLKVKGKGRPKGALGGVSSRVAPSSTRRNPSSFELPSSSAPAALLTTSTSRLQTLPAYNDLSTTALVMQRLARGHQDQYEPGTRLERAYMAGISSIYQTETMVDATTLAATAMQVQEVVNDTLAFLEARENTPSEEEDNTPEAIIATALQDTPICLDSQQKQLSIRSTSMQLLGEPSQCYVRSADSQLTDTDAPYTVDSQW